MTTVREIAEVIIGNLDENGYLTASLEEIARNGNYSLEDVEEALAVVQEFDPLGVGARNLRECLLIQLRMLDPQNALAQQIVSECMPKRPLAATERRAAQSGNAAGQAAAGQSAQRSCPRAEPPRRAGQARHGRDPQARSASRAALQQDPAAPGRAGRLLPQDGRRLAGLHERGRRAAAAAESRSIAACWRATPPTATCATTSRNALPPRCN